jgi:hypothetical protein
VDLGGERIARARLNAETLRHELSLGNAVDAVAYAYGDSEAGERIIDTVRVAARGAENGTPAAVGDAEPPALVAAALADQLAVEPDTEVSTLISLLVLSAHWSGRRPAIEGMRLSDYADRQLEYRSASSRRMTQLSSAPSTSEFVREAMRSLGAAVQDVPGSTLSRRDSKVTTQADIMIALAARIDELAARTDYEHAILREQMRQQTWMQQTWCETAEADWSEVVPEARPIIAAIELAQRTRGATPAVSAEALLGSVLQSDGRGWGIDPAAAVAAAGPYIADRWRVAPHPFLFPLAAELSRWRERKADRDEPEGWRLSPDRAAEDRLAEDRQDENVLSLQAYREALALRLLGYD